MRFPPISLALALLLAAPPVSADAVSILVQHSPLAGSQYYAAQRHWQEMRIGDRLVLTREADNRHDRHAVRIDWQGRQIGYVPRAENRAVARALDRGERLEARIVKLRSPSEAPDPWQRIEFAVYLIL